MNINDIEQFYTPEEIALFREQLKRGHAEAKKAWEKLGIKEDPRITKMKEERAKKNERTE